MQEPFVVATYPVEIEVKATEDVTEYKTRQHNILKSERNENLGSNCWKYASSKKQLPKGLFDLKSKIGKIKRHEPRVGDVGITREGPQGHLVVVEKIKENSIIISEGNYRHGFITWRELPRSSILGYM